MKNPEYNSAKSNGLDSALRSSATGSTKAGSSKEQSNQLKIPQITLPKGGGAIKSIDEKFSVNAVNGTAALTIPFPFSPSRNAFMPSMALGYNSGAGNGVFGLGWNAEPPTITRKTEKKLPEYNDAIESDTFIFSGAEDLVPALKKDDSGNWIKDENIIDGIKITRYRPRIEGGFARIEKIAKSDENVYWKVTSRDNIVSIFGKSESAQIFDPKDKTKIFKWFLEFSCDDKGNCFQVEYKKEDKANVPNEVHEKNRRNDFSEPTNAYPKRVKYCNKNPFNRPVSFPDWENLVTPTEYLLELVLDYGEHNADNPQPGDAGDWGCRLDPFSDYRAGFEIRTYRLCQRVLMFHHFPELNQQFSELGDKPTLVRSMDFKYDYGTAFTFLKSITQKGFIRTTPETYSERSLPPLAFTYEPLGWNTQVRSLPKESLENLPVGIDDQAYQWIDLYSEGISGILTEQASGWYYKSNLGDGNFDAVKLVSPKPSFNGLSVGAVHFQDLDANGQKQLVNNELHGYFELNDGGEWNSLRSFKEIPNIDVRDPNVKYLDLGGDGRADLLISEDDVFVWYASKGKSGFDDDYRLTRKSKEEEKGPIIVFADGTQSIVLADMSGDGLMDIVRIRNKEIIYWPNLGYGKFGAKVCMSNAPLFDNPDHFNSNYVKLADLDGSGITDIVYLGKDSFKIYFNQSGNSWSEENIISGENPIPFPKLDDHANVNIIDLLGNGTGCIVWSSLLPRHAANPLRYIDLMGGKKPHIMTGYKNNMGKETFIEYEPSTFFYLKDKEEGTPWITKLPFPLHVVHKVTVTDKWRQTRFSSHNMYHHAYYDYGEREFRGFGRVDQVDTETFGEFAEGNISSPYITEDKTLYQPPVMTKTWFHTGAFLDKEKILSHFALEYFEPVSGSFTENKLPEPDLNALGLTIEEYKEALRSCKGMMLRQEVYELDVDELENENYKPVKLFSSAYHNCHIQLLQPQKDNDHAVFLTTESEAITYNYELDLSNPGFLPDPRIAHTLNLETDDLGNVLRAIAVVYPRIGRHADTTLPDGAEQLIADVQKELHLAYTVNKFTQDVMDENDYRLRVPCEVKNYELSGLSPSSGSYFSLEELRNVTAAEISEIAYHILPNTTTLQKRMVDCVRILYFKPDLKTPEFFGQVNALALPYETYKLALTGSLLDSVFPAGKLTSEVLEKLSDAGVSGYLSGPTLASLFPEENTSGQYWIRSGIAGFADDAAEHFYLPEKYTDPFGNVTTLAFDTNYDLYIKSSDDPVGNHSEVITFDFRVMAPSKMKDINNNESEILFDIIGLPAAMALKGKGDEGDNLTDVSAEIEMNELIHFFTDETYDETQTQTFLGNATARYVYYLGELTAADGTITYGNHPACAAGIMREKHVAQLNPGEVSPMQIAFQYSDGSGTVIALKVQAEPETEVGDIRWITNGKTILNNKGKPVKQYEPYFTPVHTFEEPAEVGVTPVMYYDAAGRLVRTEAPDGSYSRVEFTPWFSATFDQNDTVLEDGNEWYKYNTNSTDPSIPMATPAQQNAAALAAVHAGTPTLSFFDSLGRDVVAVAHNKWQRVDDFGIVTNHEEKYLTYSKLDTEGKPLWIKDARSNRVMQYIFPFKPDDIAELDWIENYSPCYDIAGNLLFQHSMDAGDRWMLNDCTGQPLYTWDSRQHRIFMQYDALRRPVKSWLYKEDTGKNILVGFGIYGDDNVVTDSKEKNLHGKLYQHYDQSGCVTNVQYDFKGNLLEVNRTLTKEVKANGNYQAEINWDVADTAALLEAETFTQTMQYDALNRMQQLDSWHNADIPASIYVPEYNERGALKAEKLYIRGQIKEPAESNYIISGIIYDAKGQKQKVVYGNKTVTTYAYDEKTFRLTRLRTTGKIVTDDTPDEIKVLQDLSYVYDPVGNITYIRDGAQQTIFFRNQVVEPNCRYEYDALYQLIKAQGREHNGQAGTPPDAYDTNRVNLAHPGDGRQMGNYMEYYDYDGAGNILKMRHYNSTNPAQNWVRQYQYDLYSNRLISTEGAEKPGEPYYATIPTLTEKYPYNEHGSMTAMPHLQQMDWDFTEHLQHIIKGTQHAWYRYDAAKRRSRKIVEDNGIRKERVYLGGFEIYREWNGETLAEQNETIQLMDGTQRLILIDHITQSAVFTPETLLFRYQYSNHIGSACLQLNENAAIISYEEYHPFGTTSYQATNESINPVAKRYRYTGMERDEESGLEYHSARYYLPWLGRWLSADPIGIEAGINLYCYTSGNPINYADYHGRDRAKTHKLSMDEKIKLTTEIGGSVDKNGIINDAGTVIYIEGGTWIPPEDQEIYDIVIPWKEGLVEEYKLYVENLEANPVENPPSFFEGREYDWKPEESQVANAWALFHEEMSEIQARYKALRSRFAATIREANRRAGEKYTRQAFGFITGTVGVSALIGATAGLGAGLLGGGGGVAGGAGAVSAPTVAAPTTAAVAAPTTAAVAAPTTAAVAAPTSIAVAGTSTGSSSIVSTGLGLTAAIARPIVKGAIVDASIEQLAKAMGKGLGHPAELPRLDISGKVHTYGDEDFPDPTEFYRYSADELSLLRDHLIQSVRARIDSSKFFGHDPAHGERQAREQFLIRVLNKYLQDKR